MLSMVAATAAEMERDLIRERTLDGLRAPRSKADAATVRPSSRRRAGYRRCPQSRGESVTAIARHLKIGRSDAVPGAEVA